MAFKPKTALIDIDLDLSKYLLEGDETGNIRPTKRPTAEIFLKWSKETMEAGKVDTKKELTQEESIKSLVTQIDFWYEKGYEWWIQRCTFPVIQELMEYLISQVIEVRKK